MRRKTLAAAAVLVLAAVACGGGPQERTALVDFTHDEFASVILENFPSEVTLAAGDTLVFRQIWTGEPHTVTGGKLVNEMMTKAGPFSDFFDASEALVAKGVRLPSPENSAGPLADVLKRVEQSKVEPHRTRWLNAYDRLVAQAIKLPPRANPGNFSAAEAVKVVDDSSNEVFKTTAGELPFALDEEFRANQNAAQPCFLTEGLPPKDAKTPCPDDKQRQPTFDGTASYYNSGIIPYEGPRGNTFRVRFDEDLAPGSYFFFCAVHGPGQATEVKVRPAGSDVPSQEEVSRRARAESAEFTKPMAELFRDASDGSIEVDGQTIRAPFAGLRPPLHGGINEFIPDQINAKVGEKVTWKLMGWPHTISFGVPNYFPVMQFAKNGNVSLNHRLEAPAGGSPKIPEPKEGELLRLDGGTYNGSGFFSSGLIMGEPYAEYSLRFSKPGRYRFACLLHPPMVGTLTVTP